MSRCEGQLEFLNSLAKLGYDWDDWNIDSFWCDRLGADKDWVLQFPAKYDLNLTLHINIIRCLRVVKARAVAPYPLLYVVLRNL